MNAKLLFDLTAAAGTGVILLLSWIWNRRMSPLHERFIAIGHITRDLTFAAGLAVAVKMVATVDDIGSMGPYLATSLLMPLYGITINLALRMYARIKADRS